MIDVLIPVLGRPWNVEPLIDSITETTTSSYEVFFICSPGDDEQIAACKKTGHHTWIVDWKPGRADYAKKINWGFDRTSQKWIFQGADDIRFTPNWDGIALRHGHRYDVIGTNDLHNPSVKRGIHSTHTLFKRSYIEKYGGTFDDTGKVFSEVYDHQWIDNEFIRTAQRRGRWYFAKRSVVEHFHPVWKNNEWDPTYNKAYREAKEDQALYVRRIRQMEQAVAR